MAPTFFLKQFGISQVSSAEDPHGKPPEEVVDVKIDNKPKISPLRFLVDNSMQVSSSVRSVKPSVKEIAAILQLTKFWVYVKPIKSKPVLHKLLLRNIPADAEPVFREPECADCHENDDGCDHCELPHSCDRPHVTSDMLMIAVAHPNALGEHAIGTFCRQGDVILQWNGLEDVEIFLPLDNLDPELRYRFIY